MSWPLRVGPRARAKLVVGVTMLKEFLEESGLIKSIIVRCEKEHDLQGMVVLRAQHA